MLVDVDIFTTAGMLCSSIGASEGIGIPSLAVGKAANTDAGSKNKKNKLAIIVDNVDRMNIP